MKLPDKPQQVADASDALWEAALRHAWQQYRGSSLAFDPFETINWALYSYKLALIDHARLLIMQGEVKEPIDPLEDAIDALWDSWSGAWAKCQMKTAIRKHLGPFLTIPEATQ